MKFTVKEPDLAYRGNLLWLPKSCVDTNKLASDLRFVVAGSFGRDPVIHTVFDSCGPHFRVPREYPVPKGVEVVDLTPTRYTQTCIDDRMEFRDERQVKAWEALQRTSGGILHLSCGTGKTALAIKWAVNNGGPILVVVYDTGTFAQWEGAIRQFTDYRGKIGVIQDNQMDWKRPVVFASISTLVRRPFLPVEARHWFQSILFDECHHVAATTLKKALPMFWGQRLGLTATPQREDCLEPIVYYHVGPVFYSDDSQPVPIGIRFLATSAKVNPHSGAIRSRVKVDNVWQLGDINIGKLRSFLAKLPARNDLILGEVEKARQKGRKVLVLSHSIDHVKLLHAGRQEDSTYIYGDTPRPKRLQALREFPVVFATINVASEALDAPDLDTIFFVTPFQAWIPIKQGTGRAQRPKEGKQPARAIILYDDGIEYAERLCRKLMSKLKANGYEYEVVRPRQAVST